MVARLSSRRRSATVPLRVPAVLACLLASGCAGTSDGKSPSGNAQAGQLVDGRYVLSSEEMALDCRRINGRMQVRLLELRGAEHKTQASDLSRGARTVTSTVMWTDTSANAEARLARDRPMLEAYNRRLAELGCASYELDKELTARPSAAPPSPTVPAPAGKAAAKTVP